MSSDTSLTLIQRIRTGNLPLAWEEFYQCYWRLIFLSARQRGCSEHTAEEVVQEVMLAIYRTRDVLRFDPARGRFRDWLFGIVRNTIAKRRRRPEDRIAARGGEESVALLENQAEESWAQTDAQWENSFELSVLGAMLDVVRREVSPRVYQAFELTTLHELPAAEVALLTGQTRSAVYQAKSRVLGQLRQLGLSYKTRGELSRSLRRLVDTEPPASLQQRLSQQTQLTMISRLEEKEGDDDADH